MLKVCKLGVSENCEREMNVGCNDNCDYFQSRAKLSEIKEFTTKELVDELRKREGVQAIDVKPYHPYFISVDEDFEDVEIDETGPAIILVVRD